MADTAEEIASPMAGATTGHYYWDRGLGDSLNRPEKIADPAEVERRSTDGSSVWNAAGTWEERSIGSWAKDSLRERLLGRTLSVAPLTSFVVTKVCKVDGQASVLFTRGKKRVGFNFDVELEWEGEYPDHGKVMGVINLADVSESSYDLADDAACRVVSRGTAPKSIEPQIVKNAAKASAALSDVFAALLEDLRARA
eukprot:a464_588.p2 GENE.a464_588~~a464_588.p2  ORF type:complete len:222 (-),score=49.53 a464_588:36-626(-)